MSDRDQLVLDAISGRRANASGWIRANCPFCADLVGKEDRTAALGVSASKGFYKCWRCGSKGRLRSFDEDEQQEDVAEPTEQALAVELPEGFTLLEDAAGSMAADPVLDYLALRGVGLDLATEIGMGLCFRGYYAGRIIVPVFDLGGVLANWVARTWCGDAQRYLYARGGRRPLFNGGAVLVDTDVPVLVVEGVFDALPYYPNAVATLGKPIPAQVDELRAAKRPVVVVFDADTWGEGLSEHLAMALVMEGVRADFLRLEAGADPGSVNHDGLWDRAIALCA